MVRLELTPLASECVYYISEYHDTFEYEEPYPVWEICDEYLKICAEDIDDAEAWWYAIKHVMENRELLKGGNDAVRIDSHEARAHGHACVPHARKGV